MQLRVNSQPYFQLHYYSASRFNQCGTLHRHQVRLELLHDSDDSPNNDCFHGGWLWGIAVALIFPKALKSDGAEAFKEFLRALSPCFDRHHESFSSQSASVRPYLVFLVVSLLVLPTVIIMTSYSYIFIIAWKQRRQIREEEGELTVKREMKGARTVAIVVGICLVSFIPLLSVLCLRFLTSSPITAHKIHAVYLVASLNACWNPLIYCWRNENFRNSFKRLLKCKA